MQGRAAQAIYKVCEELSLPVLIHIDTPSTHRERYNPDINGLTRMAQKFPETTFIGHGPGFWREISGDVDPRVYPTGPKFHRDLYPEEL